MTAVIQGDRKRASLAFPMPIYSVDEGKIYLVMERGASGVLIRKSERTKNKLGRYWKVWVRDLLRKLDEKYVGQIAISSRGVWLASERPVDEWFWAASHLLANVVPLAQPPMTWQNDGRDGLWKVHLHADLTSIIANVVLPSGARRSYVLYGGDGYVQLQRRGVGRTNCTFPMSDVRLMVEQQVAQACTRDGVPLNWDEIWLSHRRRRLIASRSREVRRPTAEKAVVTVDLPPVRRERRRTIRGVPVERDNS